MYCTNCGNEIDKLDKYCSGCGNPTSNEEIGCAKIRCPYCMSTNLQTTTKGFSITKAATGAILIGGIGLLAGTIGSNKVKITCLKCGKIFNTSAVFVDDSGLSNHEITQINDNSIMSVSDSTYWILLLIFAIISGFLAWGIFSWIG